MDFPPGQAPDLQRTCKREIQSDGQKHESASKPLNLINSLLHKGHTLDLFGATKRYGAPLAFDFPYIENGKLIHLSHYVFGGITVDIMEFNYD